VDSPAPLPKHPLPSARSTTSLLKAGLGLQRLSGKGINPTSSILPCSGATAQYLAAPGNQSAQLLSCCMKKKMWASAVHKLPPILFLRATLPAREARPHSREVPPYRV
jgi:hypothetical protein